MAGDQKEEFDPLLPAGFHDFNIESLRRLCVDFFADSLTRSAIMTGLESVIALLQSNGLHGNLWVDGSFTTHKLNPADVDMLFVMQSKDFMALTAEQLAFLAWFQSTNLKGQYHCDNYVMVRDETNPTNDWTFAYWLRQFGFSRADQMKGIALIKLPFVVLP